jgi:hypothetical protein
MTRPWIVPDHGALEHHEENLWSVSAGVQRMPLRRRMTVVRLRDRRLVIWSCIPLAEPAMRELEAWGTPAFIVVPNAAHRLDAPAYKARYPAARVLCASDARAKVEKVVHVDGTLEELASDPSLHAERVPGTGLGEVALRVTSPGGRMSVVLNDVVFNHPHVRGLAGMMLRAIGSSGAPRVTLIARTLIVKDKAALAAYLLELAALPGLARVIVSHVELIDRDPAGVLRKLAATLG